MNLNEKKAMTNLQFVKNEIKRYNTRHGTNHKPGAMVSADLDIWENFISVSLPWGKPPTIGYAYDIPNVQTGLGIATFRALRRIDGRI